MRKVAFAGLGALFMTEEGIRTAASQLKLPKGDAWLRPGPGGEDQGREMGRVLSEEVRRFLRSEKLRERVPPAPRRDERGRSPRRSALVPDPAKKGLAEARPEVKVTSVRPRATRRKHV